MALDIMTKSESFRLFEDQPEKINQVVNRLPDKYENKSHFVRVAIMKLLNEEEAERIFNKIARGGVNANRGKM